jgi:LPXTG-site transpeptidase (sortase) family protein
LASVNQPQQNPTPSVTSRALANSFVTENIGPGLPVRLKIPKIKVNAVIDYVGLTPQGTMGIPTVPSRAAWFKLGARPGEAGSAVISGHVNWYNGAYSIFLNLNKLKPGDKISVLDDKGATISFVVRQIVTYGANQDATNIFSNADGLAHLNLITCSGTWDKVAKQYSKRLVVFTDKE